MENAYLRKPYDTLKVYNSALNMCKYYLKCDELAQVPNEKGKIKNKYLSLIHISEPTRQAEISYAVFCLKKKKKKNQKNTYQKKKKKKK